MHTGNSTIEAPRASPANRASILAAFGAIYFLWGANFLAIRYAVAEVPPFITIAIRCAGGAIIWFAWLAWRGGLARMSLLHWRNAAIAGTLLFLGCHGLLAWAMQRVPSGQAALMLAAIPLWLVVLDAWRVRRMPSARVLAGLGLGMAGVGLLTVGAHTSAVSASGAEGLIDRGILFLSTLGWAAGSIVARDSEHPESAVQWSAMQLAVGAIVVGAVAAGRGEFSHWHPTHLTLRGSVAVAFLIIAGTVLGFGAYTWLLQVTTPALVGTYAFVNPIVALVIAALVGDESLTARKLLAAAVIVSAVLLVTAAGAAPRGSRESLRDFPGSASRRAPRRSGG